MSIEESLLEYHEMTVKAEDCTLTDCPVHGDTSEKAHPQSPGEVLCTCITGHGGGGRLPMDDCPVHGSRTANAPVHHDETHGYHTADGEPVGAVMAELREYVKLSRGYDGVPRTVLVKVIAEIKRLRKSIRNLTYNPDPPDPRPVFFHDLIGGREYGVFHDGPYYAVLVAQQAEIERLEKELDTTHANLVRVADARNELRAENTRLRERIEGVRDCFHEDSDAWKNLTEALEGK